MSSLSDFRGNGRRLLAPSHRSRFTVDRPPLQYFGPSGGTLPRSNVQHSEFESQRSSWDEHFEKIWGYGRLSRDQEISVETPTQVREPLKSKKKRKKAKQQQQQQQQQPPQPTSNTSIKKNKKKAKKAIERSSTQNLINVLDEQRHELQEFNSLKANSDIRLEMLEMYSPGVFQSSNAAHARTEHPDVRTSIPRFEQGKFADLSFIDAPSSSMGVAHQDLFEPWFLNMAPARDDHREHMPERVHVNEESVSEETFSPMPGSKLEMNTERREIGVDEDDSELEEGEIREFPRQVSNNIKLEMKPEAHPTIEYRPPNYLS